MQKNLPYLRVPHFKGGYFKLPLQEDSNLPVTNEGFYWRFTRGIRHFSRFIRLNLEIIRLNLSFIHQTHPTPTQNKKQPYRLLFLNSPFCMCPG